MLRFTRHPRHGSRRVLVLVAAGGTKTVTGGRSHEAQPGRWVSRMLPSSAQGTAPPPRPRDSLESDCVCVKDS
jgi:hypothetical protein